MLTVEIIKKKFNLKVLSGGPGLTTQISGHVLYRPGVELSGFFNNFNPRNIQLLAESELGFLSNMDKDIRQLRVQELFLYGVPCVIVNGNCEIPFELLEISEEFQISVLAYMDSTDQFTTAVLSFLGEHFAPVKTMHGTFVEIYGIGVLICGDSGIGKSECGLELVERGHRLICDDVVTIKKLPDGTLLGISDNLIGHHMEIRGVGIIEIKTLFGIRGVLDKKDINIIIRFESLEPEKEYDRLGVSQKSTEILKVKVPTVTIPVHVGKSLSTVVEAVALNEHLKIRGVHTAQKFIDTLFLKLNPGKALPDI